MEGQRPSGQWSAALPQQLIDGVREEWHWITLALVVVGSILVAASVFSGLPPTGLSAFVGCFLLICAALIALQRSSFAARGGALQRRLRAAVVSNGVGFYGAMTLSRFLQLELHDLIDGLAGLEATRAQARAIFQDWLIGFSVQSLMNSIDAFMWPLKLISAYGTQNAAIVAGSAWLLYFLGSKVFPEVHAEIEQDASRDAKAAG